MENQQQRQHTSLERFKSSLEPEIVSSSEIAGLFDFAQAILSSNGQIASVNGVESRVSKAAYEDTVDGKKLYARVFEYTARGAQIAGLKQQDALFGIVFDDTPDTAVVTRNARAIKFERLGSSNRIVVDNGLDPRVNDRDDIRLIRDILNTIYEKSVESELKQKQYKAEKWSQRRESVAAFFRNNIEAILPFGLITVAFGAMATVLLTIENKSFDEESHTLPNRATELEVNDSGAPLFDVNFLSPDYQESAVPTLERGDTLTNENVLRDILITDQLCETRNIETNGNETLRVWTDYQDSDGKSLADKLAVTFTEGLVEVCYQGDEPPKDTARVLLTIQQDATNQ